MSLPLATLLKTHTRTNSISVIATGAVVEVKIPKPCFNVPPDRTDTCIKDFTSASRMRLLKMSGKIDWGKSPNPLFVTVTYPDQRVPSCYEQITGDRDELVRFMENYLKVKLPIIWRAEWMPRLTGTRVGEWCPHMHLMVFTCRRICKEALNEWWKRNIKWNHYCRTEVKRVRKGEQAGYYISKYISKLPESSPSLVNAPYLSKGRHWGIRRKTIMKWHQPEVFEDLDEEELYFFLQAGACAMRNFQEWGLSSFTLLGKGGMEAVKLLRQKRVDSGQLS